MDKKSIAASWRAGYHNLVANPAAGESAHGERNSNLAMLYLPPYIAIALGVGAGMQALAHFITLGSLTVYLMGALFFSVFVSYGSRVAGGGLARFCNGMRWPFVIVLLFLALSSRSSQLIPAESEGEGNSVVAVLVGLTTIMSVLLVGARSGGRTVPLSAPLVPGLSLFGLLSLVSVDTIVQICFLFYVASALYILAYERFLRRYVREDETTSNLSAGRLFPPVTMLSSWAAGALLVCSVWFGLFMLGGALLYYPVQTILPRLISPQISKIRAAAQGSLMDFRGASSVMELRGGNYVLSDREVLHITIQQGEPSGLWRGRVYERYQRLRWMESENSINAPASGDQLPTWLRGSVQRRSAEQFEAILPPIDPRMGTYRDVVELVEPMEGAANAVYASGAIISRHDSSDVATDGGDPSDYLRQQRPYIVLSKVIQPQLGQLSRAPGVSQTALRGMSPDSPVRGALEPPDDENTRRTISAIAQQIRLSSTRKIATPYDAVRATSEYLIQNCKYSLRSPAVPTNQDAVVFFLTESHAGACDMFASSMALILRELGVPARVASGYLQPEATSTNRKGTPERPMWIVREKDAHAWVEYYVPGLGWLSYDPTLGTRSMDDSIGGQISEFLALPAIRIPWRTMAVPCLGLMLLLLGLVWSYVEKRNTMLLPATPREQERARVSLAYREAVRLVNKKVKYNPAWTPREYDDRVSRSHLTPEARQEFSALTYLYVAALYQENPPAVDPDQLKASLQRLRKQAHH